MAYPSHIVRGALRHALRTHRDADLILQGRLVNSLTLADLKAALAALGEDPDAIAAAALTVKTANAPKAPQPKLSAKQTARRSTPSGPTVDDDRPRGRGRGRGRGRVRDRPRDRRDRNRGSDDPLADRDRRV